MSSPWGGPASLGLALLLGQVKVEVPQNVADYGAPGFADLSSIAFTPEVYQRRHVRTTGRLDLLESAGPYFLLTDGSARVLILLVEALDPDAFKRSLGSSAEIRGIVRAIRPKQYVRGMDLDLIEDPTLPVLPAPRVDFPKVSITALSIFDREQRASSQPRTAERESAGDILFEPARWSGKKVRIVGLFRGSNLFGDLPAASRRDPKDWVLKDEATALWISGKEPKGKGWALDPGYKGDSVRWIEVVGTPEVVGGVLYLRALKLGLATRPQESGDPQP